MIILFSKRNSRTEKEIIEILTSFGGNYISDKVILKNKEIFTLVSKYKKTTLNLNCGIALFLSDTNHFSGQEFSKGMVGICEYDNSNALSIFQKNEIPIISCGMNPKSTITLSSVDKEKVTVSLQRIISDINGSEIEPFEFIINLKSDYSLFSVMASAAILLIYGITPNEFQ